MEAIKIKDMLSYRILSSLEFSPDQKQGVFVVTQANKAEDGYEHCLYTLDAESGEVKQLTSGGAERSFCFSGADTVVFPGLRNGADKKRAAAGELLTVFYEISMRGGEARELFRVPLKGASAKKIDADLYLVTSLYDNARPDFEHLAGEELKKARAEYDKAKDVQVIDELPFWFNGRGFINKIRRRFYTFRISTGELTPITGPLFDGGAAKYWEEGGKIVYSGLYFESFQGQNKGLYTYDLKTGETKCILESDTYTIINFTIDKKNRRVIFVGVPIFRGTGIPGYSLYAAGLDDGTLTPLYEQIPEDYGYRTVSDIRMADGNAMTVSGDRLYLVTSWDNTSGLSYMDFGTKELHHITPDALGVDFFACCGERFFTVGFYDSQLQEIYEVNPADGSFRQITHINSELFRDKYVAKPESVSFINSDGIRIDGFVLYPMGYDPQKRYPGILEIHGGPRNNYGDCFMHEMQVMAGMGAFVFFCNPRGSAARGEDFADIYGAYGTNDYKDIMEFTDEVLRRYPQIDGERLGVTGGSYGGYMVNWIIGHTDRFKAASSQRSISNWISYYGGWDIGPRISDRVQKGNTPWDGFDVLWNTSPIKYADQAVTPTLFINSDADYRCYISEGMQMYTALAVRGIPTRLCLFHGENHSLSRTGKPRNRMRRLKEINDWLFKYIGQEETDSEKETN